MKGALLATLPVVGVLMVVGCDPGSSSDPEPSRVDVSGDVVARCQHCIRAAKEVPHLDLVEQATREYLLLVEIEASSLDPSPRIAREIQEARGRAARILPRLRPALPHLLRLEKELGELSHDLAGLQRVPGAVDGVWEVRGEIGRLIEGVQLARAVMEQREDAVAPGFQEPRILETLEVVLRVLRELETK